MFEGPLEQPGRVVGRVRIGEREYPVDCGSVRDRSWGPREMRSELRLGNAHGTSRAGNAFFAYVTPDARGVERITSGYLLRDGRAARVLAGERQTEWDGNHPRSVRLDLHDALGRRRVDLLPRPDRARMLRSAGTPVIAAEIRIVDAEDNEVPLGHATRPSWLLPENLPLCAP